MSDESPKGHIHLLMDQIPEVRDSMPIMKLGAPSLAPKKQIRDIVRIVAPEAKFKELGKSGGRGAHHKDRLVAFVNPKSGESNVFPTLGMLLGRRFIGP